MDLHIYDHNCNNSKNDIHINWNGEKINNLLETHRKEIRLKYLNIIFKIIEKNSQRYKFLNLEEINLVKMSLINEKNPFKSHSIHQCLKLLLIEKLVKKNEIKKINYHGNNLKLEKSLEIYCKNSNLDFHKSKISLNLSMNKIYSFVQGNTFFIKQIIKNIGLNNNIKKYSDVSIFSYFVHFNSLKKRKFKSNLWGNLTDYFNSEEKKINWFHFFVPSHQVPDSRKANYLKKKFNLNKYENHNLINSYLSKKGYIKSYYLFYKLFLKNLIFFGSEKFFFKNKISNINFCYFLKNDYLSSFFGPTLIYNIMNILILKNLLKNIPKQKIGIYIIENQSWEHCFIKFWKKYNHGKLIAYFNSSVRFWDLRYLKKKHEFKNKNENPDLYLINNKIFETEVKKLGFPIKKLFLVEALRYSKLKPSTKNIKNNKIIIVGDILFDETDFLLSFINKIKNNLVNYKFYFKPHPTMTKKSIFILKSKYNFFNVININSDKFKYFEFTICSNGTSANLDCLIQKINFCSVRPFNSLNLYPIEKYQKYFQVKTSKELLDRIKKPKKVKSEMIFKNTEDISRFKKIFNKVGL
tara:strand:- start:650 stop:2389 length:1740 start_codon:yes stop_codon:yes gene_type:complete